MERVGADNTASEAKSPALCSDLGSRVTLRVMNTAIQPNVKFVQTPDYRETYANSVQIRVNVWDFFLVFGTMQQNSETQAEMRNFQGIYLTDAALRPENAVPSSGVRVVAAVLSLRVVLCRTDAAARAAAAPSLFLG